MDGGFADYDYGETQHQNHQDQQYEDYSEYGVESNANVDSQNANPRDSSAGKLFVGGVPWETSEDAFTSYFSEYGEITDSVLMRDKHTGRPRGFGFVTFAESAVADKVLEKDHVIDGKMVEVKRTVPREDMEPRTISKTKKIFVGGIPPSLTEDQLKEYFESYGSIIDHQIMLDHTTGRSRGFGFVTFESEESVDKIFTDGEKHELGGRQVEIKRAEPKRGGGGGDYSGSGGGGKFHGGFGNGGGRGRGRGGYEGRYSGRYNGEMSRGYGGYGEDYGGYGAYGGGYGATPAGFYGAYGGYGYGFVPPMYGAAGGYGGYGAAGYGNPSSYMGTDGYGSGGKGFGSGRGGYGNGSSKGYGNGGSGTGRYHPYDRR